MSQSMLMDTNLLLAVLNSAEHLHSFRFGVLYRYQLTNTLQADEAEE